METSVLTSKGQLLIPKRLRKKYGIEAGVKVIFEEAEGGVVIRPINDQYFKAFRGILTSSGKLKEEIKAMKLDEKKLEDRKLNIHKTIKKK
ncbi:AbrB/MazE/SpoVT family DNA-binding domain-containing protein [Agriterribacter humi]|jgi:AbrB family looped-hinge helix DNA binding protein|uniref:AbrB/MazE/SpoVT family DNA-binding domain-containing protein n=1 Tax=Agriterribacter humi TaxID=1104781 RepID=UPI00186B0058|nr:AbrB/MazE/SpoVT family DNA-binding domain-containing protein [Agriterribacter humi]